LRFSAIDDLLSGRLVGVPGTGGVAVLLYAVDRHAFGGGLLERGQAGISALNTGMRSPTIRCAAFAGRSRFRDPRKPFFGIQWSFQGSAQIDVKISFKQLMKFRDFTPDELDELSGQRGKSILRSI
jgi:hypothetical protein